MNKRRVVSAAMLMKDGLIVPGARHFSPDMRAVLKRIYGVSYYKQVKEQGFIDTHGNFLSREEAWGNATFNGQLRKEAYLQGVLFSEDLY